MARFRRETGTAVRAYSLTPNHVPFFMVSSHEDVLRASIAEAPRRYTRHVNVREG